MIHDSKTSQTDFHLLAADAADRYTLSDNYLERVDAWGGATHGVSHVFRPSTTTDLQAIFALARQTDRSVAFRGGGNSYGDAAMNDENILLDLRRLNRILGWNPATGRITVEPGVTLSQLFQHVMEDGWWPPVCTGTMQITIGGGAAMNVHGKNAYKVGTIGEHIFAFDMMLPSGEIISCTREENSDIFFAAIGGMGLLGCFTSLTLQMKRIYSGLLDVESICSPNLGAMLGYLEDHQTDSDYLVGWIDSFAGGRKIGRGEIHRANYVAPGADPYPQQSLRLENQHLSPNIMGILPRSIMWLFMRPFTNNLGWRLVSTAKYWAGRRGHGKKYQQTHAAFHFLLDYIPGWKQAYGPGGLIQYQAFVPADKAEMAFSDLLQLGLDRRLPNYLSVLKRHRPDPFLLTHGLDGFSLAMDYRVTPRNQEKLVAMARQMDEIVLRAGGRFYFAKDSTLGAEATRAFLGDEALAQFHSLKQRCDPDGRLQTNLWRRLFPAG